MNESPRNIPLAILTAAFALIYAITLALIPGGDFEEAMNGLLPRGFLSGLTLSPVQYQYQIWAHGPLVFGLVLTPLYALTDSLMLWVKLLGFGFALLGFWSWNRLAQHRDRRGAWMFAALWLAPAPYAFQQLHTAWANHMESMALIGALLLLAARDAQREGGAASAFVLGLSTAGAGLFCTQAWLVVPSMALILVSGVRRAWTAHAARSAAYVAGLAPAFVVQTVFIRAYAPSSPQAEGWATPWRWAEALFLTRFSTAPSVPAVEKLAALASKIAPAFLGYSVPVLSALLPALAVVGVVLAFRSGTRRPRTAAPAAIPIDAALALFAAAWLFAYAFSPFAIEDPTSVYDQRYLIVLVPVIWWFAARAASATRWGWIAIAAFVVAGAASMAGAWAEAGTSPFTRTFPLGLVAERGDNTMYFAETHWRKFARPGGGRVGSACERAAGEIDAAPVLGRPWTDLVFRSVGEGFDAERAACVDPADVRAWDLAFGRGRASAEPTPEDRCLPRTARAVFAAAEKLAPAQASAFRQGAGYAWAHCRDRGFRAMVFGEMLDPASDAARDVAVGLGRRVAAYAGDCDGISVDGTIQENLIDTDLLDPALAPAARHGVLDELIFPVASRCRYVYAPAFNTADQQFITVRWSKGGVVLEPRGDFWRVRVLDWGE